MWYAIAPGASRKRFEDFARTLYPNDAKSCSNFLRHKNVMITPKLIRDEGSPIITVRPFCLLWLWPYARFVHLVDCLSHVDQKGVSCPCHIDDASLSADKSSSVA